MSLKIFFISTFSFLLIMVADIMIRFSMVSYNSVKGSSQVYMTNIVHHKIPNESDVFKQRNVWQYGLWSFQAGGTKLERFLPKDQHTERKLCNFENWVNG